MKLYFSPGACSRAANIILHEARITVETVQVDLRTHTLVATGANYYDVNPKGYVPALELEDGSLLTENVALLEYLGDRSGLLAPPGDMARYHTLEWLAFVNSEIHKTFSPLFNPAMPEAARNIFIKRLEQRFALLEAHLASHDYLAGDFGIADAYAFTVLGWAEPMGIDLSGFPHINAYQQRIAARDSVKAAIAAEN